MRLFGKKEEEEIDEEELIEEKLPSRRFKDLKPENRKKRVVPLKPWGKRERLIVLWVLLGTIIASGTLAASARSWKLPGLPKLTMPSFNLFKEETIIVGGKLGADKEKKARDVINAFSQETKSLSGVYALYVVELTGGATYGVNHSQVLQAASLIKLPIMSMVYKKYEDGKIDIDKKVPGSTATYRELVEAMGKRSDNSAQILLVKSFGQEEIQKYIDSIDMTKTSLYDNETAPEDIGEFFKKLWGGELVSEKSRGEIFEYLTNTIYEEHLTAGIPEGVQVAHKYGREVHVVNDTGIVFTKEPFVIVIMSDGVVESEADEVFPTLSRVVYQEVLKE